MATGADPCSHADLQTCNHAMIQVLLQHPETHKTPQHTTAAHESRANRAIQAHPQSVQEEKRVFFFFFFFFL